MAISLAGCLGGLGGFGGDGEPPRTVTPVDVVDLPAGTATGTTFSGIYAMDRMFVTGCHCRRGVCDVHVTGTGLTFPSIQQDGTFRQEFQGEPGTVARGGIDEDGSYTIGAASEDIYGVSYALFEGHINLVDGVPQRGEATLSATVTAIPGLNVDCDVRVNEAFHYEGPL